MFYRLDGSNYLFVGWSRLDACKSPDDKDARGRRCGARATSYKGSVKSLDKMKRGGFGADVKASQKALERRARRKGQDFSESKEARAIDNMAIAMERGAQIKAKDKAKSKRKFGVVEGGGKGSDEKADPRVAKANRELRKLSSQLPSAMANTDKVLAEMKSKFGGKGKSSSKPRKPRVVDKPQPGDTPLSAPARELMRSMKETDRLLNEAKGGKPKRQRSAKPGTSKVVDINKSPRKPRRK